MTEQQQKQQQQNDDEKLKIAEKVFNPQVAQFVPSEDISYEISVHPDLMPHIIGTHGSNLSRLSSKFAVRFVFPTSDTKLQRFARIPSRREEFHSNPLMESTRS